MKIERVNFKRIIITIETEQEALAFWDFANLTKESAREQSDLHCDISQQIDKWFVENIETPND